MIGEYLIGYDKEKMERRAILFFIIISLICTGSFAQTGEKDGLILSGTAYDGTVEMHDDYALWRVKLRMEFVNEDSKPIILIDPFTEYGGWKNNIAFLGMDLGGFTIVTESIKNIKYKSTDKNESK